MPLLRETTEVRPAVVVQIDDGEGLGVAGDHEAALGGGDRREMPAAVAAKQLAQAAVKPPTAGIGA